MISVCTAAVTNAAMPMTVLPAPQGSTNTPLPPRGLPSCHQAANASAW